MRLTIDTSSLNLGSESLGASNLFTGINIFGYEVDPNSENEEELFQLYAEQLKLSEAVKKNRYSFADQISILSEDPTWASLAETALGLRSIVEFEGKPPSNIRVPKEATPDGTFIQALNKTFNLGIKRSVAHGKTHNIVIIHSIAINKKHASSREMSMSKALDILLKACDITSKSDVNLLMLQAYPLQYFSKKEREYLTGYEMKKKKDLMKDTKRLATYYQKLGFHCMNNGRIRNVTAPWLGKVA